MAIVRYAQVRDRSARASRSVWSHATVGSTSSWVGLLSPRESQARNRIRVVMSRCVSICAAAAAGSPEANASTIARCSVHT